MSGYPIKTSSQHASGARALGLPVLTALALAVALAALAGPVAGQDSTDFLTPPADAQKHPSGVLSKVVTAGTGENYPSERHLISLDFVGISPQGGKLYSSYDLGKPLILTLQSAFPPWREVLEQMVTGEKRRIWLPEHLVATSRGGPAGASIFELELRGLKAVPSPPRDLVKPPEGATRTPSGASTVLLTAGIGTERPGPDSTVLVHYIGWTVDGNTFDSSYTRGRPTAFRLDQIMPGFADTVQMMVAREKRQVWIPGPVAAGNWVGAPKGALVFEIEMVRILPDDALQKMQPAQPAQQQPGSE